MRLPEVSAAQLTLGLTVLYALGFIVANVHLGRFELLRLELVRARYVSAALLFLTCSAIPLGLGAFLSPTARAAGLRDPSVLARVAQPSYFDRFPRWAVAVTIVLTSFGIYFSLIVRIAVEFREAAEQAPMYFASAAVMGWFISEALFMVAAQPRGRGWSVGRGLALSMAVCFFVLSLPAVFSESLYPVIRQEFAGGAAWLAQVTWSDSTAAVARDFSLDTVAIVERDNETLSMVACRRKGQAQRVVVPVGAVADVRLIAQVVVGRFTCPGSPRKPAAAP